MTDELRKRRRPRQGTCIWLVLPLTLSLVLITGRGEDAAEELSSSEVEGILAAAIAR